MRKNIILFVIMAISLGVLYWLVSPLFTERRVSESFYAASLFSLSSEIQPKVSVVRRGTFEPQAGHSAEGTATLVKVGERYFVRFEDDFQVTNGPDLFVYLGRRGENIPDVRLGALKGNIGSQNYEVPEGIDPSAYDEVWVWCRAFTVFFAKAALAVPRT
jgi:hypothetical protein